MKDQDARSVQMESLPQRTRRATRTWCSLLGHLRPSSDLSNRPLFPHPFHPAWLAKPTTRLRHGLSPGPSGNDTLHDAFTVLQTQRDQLENTRTQLLCNVYSQNQAGHVWNKFMDQGTR